MAALNKMFKKVKSEQVLGIVGLLVLLFALYKYSQNKNLFKMGMTQGKAPLSPATYPPKQSSVTTSVKGASSGSTYAPYNGASTSATSTSATTISAMNKAIANPADLLPKSNGSNFSGVPAQSNLSNIGLLNPTQVVGINTQGSSLRNANLQVRSEPPNPRSNTNCPWNISTIESDTFRKPLEIGAGA